MALKLPAALDADKPRQVAKVDTPEIRRAFEAIKPERLEVARAVVADGDCSNPKCPYRVEVMKKRKADALRARKYRARLDAKAAREK